MEHIAALLLIIGCSGDLKACGELPAPVPLYETVEECESVLPALKVNFRDASPKVFAACVEIDPALAEEDLELTWDVTERDGLTASIGVPEFQVASSPHRRENDFLSQE